MSNECKVYSKCNPVDNPVLREEVFDLSKGKEENKFIGYYGTNRTGHITVNGRDKYWIKTHSGYDYKANEGTPVKAVGCGYIDRIRFGRTKNSKYPCPLKLGVFKTFELKESLNKLKDNLQVLERSLIDSYEKALAQCINPNDLISKYYFVSSSEIDKIKKEVEKTKRKISIIEKALNNNKSRFNSAVYCAECDKMIRSGCYGVQIWLKFDKKTKFDKEAKYAYYAHLSDVGEEIRSTLTKLFSTPDRVLDDIDNTVYFKQQFWIKTNNEIGKSGRTGNAYDQEEHLHFECRIGSGEKGEDVEPNRIVYTRFYIVNDNNKENENGIEKITLQKLKIADELDTMKNNKWLELKKGKITNIFEKSVWPGIVKTEKSKFEAGEISKLGKWEDHLVKIKETQQEAFMEKEKKFFETVEWPKILKDSNGFYEVIAFNNCYKTFKSQHHYVQKDDEDNLTCYEMEK